MHCNNEGISSHCNTLMPAHCGYNKRCILCTVSLDHVCTSRYAGKVDTTIASGTVKARRITIQDAARNSFHDKDSPGCEGGCL